MRPDVSILIVTWNSAPWIERCLRAIPAAAGARTWEAIVVDNASSDGTAALARGIGLGAARIVEAGVNRGFAGGINDAVAGASGRYLFLLNPDCEAEPGSIEALVEFLDQTGAAGAAPLLLGGDGEPQREFQLRRFPTLGSILGEVLLLDRLVPSTRSAHRYGEVDLARTRVIEQPAAAALMLRRAIVDAVGPFDERFAPAWFEDVDYCRRVHQAGGRLHLVPTARVVHAGGSSVETLGFGRFLEIWYRNLDRYTGKWLGERARRRVRMAVVAGMILRIAAAAGGAGTVPRREAIAAYRRVLAQAWRRWDETSRSS
jgi:GT2 family glycosyltransferase